MNVRQLEISTERVVDTAKVRQLNDQFRRSFDKELGQVVLTHLISDLQMSDFPIFRELIMKVRGFDSFDDPIDYSLPLEDQEESNNPYGENDFGKVVLSDGQECFFKIDYYDKDLKFGSEYPDDPELTTRVMTIMFTSEY